MELIPTDNLFDEDGILESAPQGLLTSAVTGLYSGEGAVEIDASEDEDLLKEFSQQDSQVAGAELHLLESDEDSLLDDFDDLDDASTPLSVRSSLSSCSAPPQSRKSQQHRPSKRRRIEYDSALLTPGDDSSCLNSDEPSGCQRPLDRIQSIFERLEAALEDGERTLSLRLKIRSRRAQRISMRNGSIGGQSADRHRSLFFPGDSEIEAWKFTVVLRILGFMREAILSDITLSKRDIYYRDPALFGSQKSVNRYVDDIAYTLSMPRADLHISAVAKGLMAGSISLNRRDGTSLNASNDRGGILVPDLKDIASVDMSHVDFILVIEKEATFRSIANSSVWDVVCRRGLILTGKGYPDIATRALLHFLSSPSLHNGFASPLVFGLADFDPDGIAILSTYRQGSLALIHENANLICPSLQRVALHCDQICELIGPSENACTNQALLPLTQRDRGKAKSMLVWEVLQRDGEGREWRSELQRMLMLGFKAELQLLESLPGELHKLLSVET